MTPFFFGEQTQEVLRFLKTQKTCKLTDLYASRNDLYEKQVILPYFPLRFRKTEFSSTSRA